MASLAIFGLTFANAKLSPEKDTKLPFFNKVLNSFISPHINLRALFSEFS